MRHEKRRSLQPFAVIADEKHMHMVGHYREIRYSGGGPYLMHRKQSGLHQLSASGKLRIPLPLHDARKQLPPSLQREGHKEELLSLAAEPEHHDIDYTTSSAPAAARSSMPDDAFIAYWEKRNDELRNLGIKTVGLGED